MRVFSSVRTKLTALVALTGLVAASLVPLLYITTHDQLIAEADDRVEEAERSFNHEMADAVQDLHLAAGLLASDSDTARALANHDTRTLEKIGQIFHDVYPDIDLLFADRSGLIVAQHGCAKPPSRLDTLADFLPALRGEEIHGVVAHGCEDDPSAPPAIIVARPVVGGGVVVVCLPLHPSYLDHVGGKFGLSLALLSPQTNHVVVKSSDFPLVAAEAPLGGTPRLVEQAGRSFATLRFAPEALTGPRVRYELALGMDVTDLRTVLRRSFAKLLALVVGATAMAVGVGGRLAWRMSHAIRRVSAAAARLKHQEYVHVEPILTGDELEELAMGFNAMVEGLRERDKLRETFGKYMTETLVDHLMSGRVELGGTTLPVTILFSDIRSFTTMSEAMEAHALVALLNEYFTEMVAIVIQEDGVVDKYIGDAIMAVFGAPVPKADDAVRAVRAAVRMRKALLHLNERLVARGVEPLRTGIGIHSGEVVAGNIGSERRMEYTVIGDAVNLASRLESATKDEGADILVSEDTYALVRDSVEARPVRELTVKGRAQPVMTYEVLGLRAT
jgi:adenylate cyclase